jgi:hypothetical protein
MGNRISIKHRRLVIRIVLIVIWIGLGIVLFIFNRGHTLLVDNKNVEAAGLQAPDSIKVTVDKKKTLDFFRGDRDIFEVGGGKHRIYIEFSGGRPPFEAYFTLPLGPDMFLLSVPKMINGVDPWIEEFKTQPQSRNIEEDESGDEPVGESL